MNKAKEREGISGIDNQNIQDMTPNKPSYRPRPVQSDRKDSPTSDRVKSIREQFNQPLEERIPSPQRTTSPPIQKKSSIDSAHHGFTPKLTKKVQPIYQVDSRGYLPKYVGHQRLQTNRAHGYTPYMFNVNVNYANPQRLPPEVVLSQHFLSGQHSDITEETPEALAGYQSTDTETVGETLTFIHEQSNLEDNSIIFQGEDEMLPEKVSVHWDRAGFIPNNITYMLSASVVAPDQLQGTFLPEQIIGIMDDQVYVLWDEKALRQAGKGMMAMRSASSGFRTLSGEGISNSRSLSPFRSTTSSLRTASLNGRVQGIMSPKELNVSEVDGSKLIPSKPSYYKQASVQHEEGSSQLQRQRSGTSSVSKEGGNSQREGRSQQQKHKGSESSQGEVSSKLNVQKNLGSQVEEGGGQQRTQRSQVASEESSKRQQRQQNKNQVSSGTPHMIQGQVASGESSKRQQRQYHKNQVGSGTPHMVQASLGEYNSGNLGYQQGMHGMAVGEALSSNEAAQTQGQGQGQGKKGRSRTKELEMQKKGSQTPGEIEVATDTGTENNSGKIVKSRIKRKQTSRYKSVKNFDDEERVVEKEKFECSLGQTMGYFRGPQHLRNSIVGAVLLSKFNKCCCFFELKE
eukprot:TRINITY_DN845_c0_g1_i3.p1 TRINITY_DN845_c0_g1~~TRINITY_DN845_c0_g1_i3.p1  ORF type:complete len:628 (-),score=83.42 TRINITY_DN845_c0_g1_i3:732-2615(-)